MNWALTTDDEATVEKLGIQQYESALPDISGLNRNVMLIVFAADHMRSESPMRTRSWSPYIRIKTAKYTHEIRSFSLASPDTVCKSLDDAKEVCVAMAIDMGLLKME